MTRPQFQTAATAGFLAVVALLAATWGAEPAPVKLSALIYSSAPSRRADNEKACVPCCFADACQSLEAQTTGRDPGPRSQWYLQLKAAEEVAGVRLNHGWSSPFIGHELLSRYGYCSESLCKQGRFRMGRTTDAQDQDAALHRIGPAFVTYETIPTYTHALDWMATQPSAAVVLTSSGRRGYAIVGLESGRGVWTDHWQRAGPPRVFMPTEQEGNDLFKSMVLSGGASLGPENFVIGMTGR